MNEFDAMRLLAEANPVREQDLTPLDLPDRFARRWPNRRLVLAIAIAVVIAAAVAAAYAFDGSNQGRSARADLRLAPGVGQTPGIHHRIEPLVRTGTTGPTGSRGATGALSSWADHHHALPRDVSVRFNRSGPRLDSVDVTVWVYPKRDFKLMVRYLGPPGDYNSPYPVVYRTQISADSLSSGTGGVGPSGAMGPGGRVSWDWSGTLSVRDWRGGCQSGDYEIDFDFGTSRDFEIDTSTDTFRCSGS